MTLVENELISQPTSERWAGKARVAGSGHERCRARCEPWNENFVDKIFIIFISCYFLFY